MDRTDFLVVMEVVSICLLVLYMVVDLGGMFVIGMMMMAVAVDSLVVLMTVNLGDVVVVIRLWRTWFKWFLVVL